MILLFMKGKKIYSFFVRVGDDFMKEEKVTNPNKTLITVYFGIICAFIICTIGSMITHQNYSIHLLISSLIGITGFVVIDLIFRKSEDKRVLIMTLTGVFLFFVFANALLTVTIYIYPFIIAYTAIFSIYADKLAVYAINVPYIILAVVVLIIEYTQKASKTDLVEVIIMLFAVIANCLLLSLVATTLRKEMNKSDKALKDVDEKNKKQSEMTSDIIEVVKKVSEFTDKINGIVNEVNSSTKSVASAIEEIANGATTTSEDIHTQSNLIEDIKNKINESADACTIMSNTSKETVDVVSHGNEVVNKLTEESQAVTNNSNEVSKLMDELRNECDEISNVTNVIADIAEQTNLLALNASIEAARAGDMGKGFVVVASEVGELAEKSKESTSTIAEIIEKLVDKANKSAEVVIKLVESNKIQNELVSNTRKVFEDINRNVLATESKNTLVKGRVNDVLDANEQIVKSIVNISSVSEETTANTEETYAVSNENLSKTEEAAKLALELKETLSKLEQYL